MPRKGYEIPSRAQTSPHRLLRRPQPSPTLPRRCIPHIRDICPLSESTRHLRVRNSPLGSLTKAGRLLSLWRIGLMGVHPNPRNTEV